MLVIRLARTGKKHQAYFRITVADSKKIPTAKFVEILGNYDPHAKKLAVNKERLGFYLKNGAQPSNSVAKLLKNEKISLPKWVKITEKKKSPKKKEEAKDAAPAEPQSESKAENTEEVIAAEEKKEEANTKSENIETTEEKEKEEDKEGSSDKQ